MRFFPPNLPQGFLTWNIITSLPYGLIYILLQVKLIRLRNMLKIPQSILSTVKTLVISFLLLWLWMTLYLFRDPQCQVTSEKQNQTSLCCPVSKKYFQFSLMTSFFSNGKWVGEQWNRKASKTYLPAATPQWVLDFPGGKERAFQSCSFIIIRLDQACVWCNCIVLAKLYLHFSHYKSTKLSAHRGRATVEITAALKNYGNIRIGHL